jgi:hypothetical protein
MAGVVVGYYGEQRAGDFWGGPIRRPPLVAKEWDICGERREVSRSYVS